MLALGYRTHLQGASRSAYRIDASLCFKEERQKFPLTRHELKEQLQHDQFTDSVSSALEYASSHKERLIQWATIAGVVLIVIGGLLWFNSYRRSLREKDLAVAYATLDAQVGPHNDYIKTFATQEEKTKASMHVLEDVAAKDNGTREGFLARYYLGTIKAQNGDTKGAESDLRAAADSKGDASALAKIALAQLYLGQKRTGEAQDLLRSLVNKPTDLVSKSQAQVLMAQLMESSNPLEAKHILQGLKSPGESPAISRAADQISSQIAK